MVKVRIRLSSGALMPSYAHEGDAGVDIFSRETVSLRPLERKLVGTGLFLEIPGGYEAQIRPKSGLALKHGIGMANSPGTIDSGYRGEIKVIVINFGNKQYTIEKGKKIAQMVFKKVEKVLFEESSALSDSSRNEGGFGSTGL